MHIDVWIGRTLLGRYEKTATSWLGNFASGNIRHDHITAGGLLEKSGMVFGIIAILIMLASPTTPSCYIMAKSMKNDGVLTASVIVATTLFAAFTLTFWIFLLRTFGLI